jgi:hypothetical protein
MMRGVLLSMLVAIGAGCTVTAYEPTDPQPGQQQTGSECMDAVATLNDIVCKTILFELQNNGYCL